MALHRVSSGSTTERSRSIDGNAGSGAVKRWRREFGDMDLDLFVERIPYREARGYAKRVTRSIARYTWLYGGEKMLPLDLRPPGPPQSR